MATNRIDILDAALLRPGRIDRKIEFPNPNDASRFDILKIHSRKMNLTRGIDLKKIAELMNGASGAELKGCCTEAGVPSRVPQPLPRALLSASSFLTCAPHFSISHALHHAWSHTALQRQGSRLCYSTGCRRRVVCRPLPTVLPAAPRP